MVKKFDTKLEKQHNINVPTDVCYEEGLKDGDEVTVGISKRKK